MKFDCNDTAKRYFLEFVLAQISQKPVNDDD
jgi:hypothetical protein